ncbi:MAG: hypothetical protein AB2L14_00500 [Candidatus Xenobiia bacterium LiM19]
MMHRKNSYYYLSHCGVYRCAAIPVDISRRVACENFPMEEKQYFSAISVMQSGNGNSRKRWW